MKMNDRVKYHIEKAECALRTALSFSEKESVYVISAISKALIELDNTMFAERIEAAAKEGNTSAQSLISIDKVEREDGKVEFNFHYGKESSKNELNNTPFKWDNTTSFVPAKQ
jgi:hypothetical protein